MTTAGSCDLGMNAVPFHTEDISQVLRCRCKQLTDTDVLPGGEEEDAADGEVSQQHEEPDSRREGIQEGEVTWFTTLKHTQTSSSVHSVSLKSYCFQYSQTKFIVLFFLRFGEVRLVRSCFGFVATKKSWKMSTEVSSRFHASSSER